MTERNPFETVKRKPLTTLQRARLFAEHKGICGLCHLPIMAFQRWIDEHRIPLSQGGSNDWENRCPAHEHCAKEKTKQDAADLSTIRNGYAKRIGAKVPKHPMPGSRHHPSKLRKKMNGQVVRWD